MAGQIAGNCIHQQKGPEPIAFRARYHLSHCQPCSIMLMLPANQRLIFANQFAPLLYAGHASHGVRRRIEYVVLQTGKRCGGNMQACIRGSIINQHFSVFTHHCAVAENHIAYITNAFLAFRCQKIPAGLCNNNPGSFQFRGKRV